MMTSRLLTLTAITLCFSQSVHAQGLRSCFSTASDADNDGYGWENGASCIVDTFSSGSPNFTNLEAGVPVTLTRAYWDGFEDFNRHLVCTDYVFDGMSYESYHPSTRRLVHDPLSIVPPFVGEVEITLSGASPSTSFVVPWAVDNGIYNGSNVLGTTPWLEPTTISNGQAAVRIWSSDQRYTLCSSIDPMTYFAPTGIAPDSGNNFDGTCVDTGTAGDGWGWNGSESCMVTDGSGPLASDCIDSDGDGWGWNGAASCTVESSSVSECIDSDGDGWGWNGAASCRD